MNRVELIGNLTKDVEVKYMQSGTALGMFTLAVRRNFRNKQTNEYDSDFIRCQIWGKSAENLANFAHKGSKIGVVGEIQTGSYQNDQGKTVYTTNVNVSAFDLLDTRQQSAAKNQSQQSKPASNPFTQGVNATKSNAKPDMPDFTSDKAVDGLNGKDGLPF